MANLRKFLDKQGVSIFWNRVNTKFVSNDKLTEVLSPINGAIIDIESIPIRKGANTNALAGNSTSNSSTGENATVFGSNNTASGTNSFAEGESSKARADYSHAEGKGTEASGLYSHAEGYKTTASGGFGSHAEGYFTIASGSDSHAEGDHCTASAPEAHAEGYHTTAEGSYSHAEGNYTKATGTAQHVQGKYNVAHSNYAHIVGGGISDTSRKNIHTVDWNGNAEYAGDVIAMGCGGASSISLTKVDNNLSQILWRGVLLTGSITFNIAEKYLHDGVLTLLFEASPNKKGARPSPYQGDNTALISISCSSASVGDTTQYTPYYTDDGRYTIYHNFFGEDIAGRTSPLVGLEVKLRSVPTEQNIICTVKIDSQETTTGLRDFDQFLHTISAINIKGAK